MAQSPQARLVGATKTVHAATASPIPTVTPSRLPGSGCSTSGSCLHQPCRQSPQSTAIAAGNSPGGSKTSGSSTFPTTPTPNRIYDQLFVDGTYFGHQNCLLVASTKAHVVAWHWCRQEDTFNYNRLFDKVGHAPLVVTTDGHQGSLEAIKTTWSQAHIQRCLVHVKRNIQRYVGLYPVLPSGKALRGLSLSLLQVSNLDEAAE